MRHALAAALAAAALLLAPAAPRAEEPLVDQLKKACQKELGSFCKGVKPGEGRVLACLYAFEDRVSDQCAYAVYDAAAQLEQAVAALKYVAGQCAADLDKFCAAVKPGQGRGLACLQKNGKELSEPCRAALEQVGAEKKK